MCRMRDIERQIEREERSWDAVNVIVQNNLHHFRRVWRYGDGDGGSVIDMLRERVNRSPDYGFVAQPKKKKISNSKRKKVFEADKYRCVKCGTHKDLSVDHIIAESKGGSSDLDNLQTLCKPCNSSKGTRDNQEFMAS